MLIFFISDPHLGRNYNFKMNPFTQISRRALDPIKNVEKIVQVAIDQEASLFVICGDLYDRPNIGPTFKKLIRDKIFRPLNDNQIPVVIIGGNHDSPRNLKRGSDIEALSMLQYVDIYRLPECKNVEVDGKKIGLILFPYMHPEVLAEFIPLKNIPPNERFPRAQDFIEKWIGENLEEIEGADFKFLVCHYYPSGAEIRKIPSPEVLPGEFHFKRQMLHEGSFDLCVFGHVHLHQAMWKNLVVPGSIERMDFGERKDAKGYVVYDTEKKQWEFKPLECRNLLSASIDISGVGEANSQKLIQKILEGIPSNVENSWIKQFITLTSAQKNSLTNLTEIEDALQTAFHYEMHFINKEMKIDTILTEFTLNPITLFRDFIDQAFSDHPHKDDLKETGLEIVNDLLAEMEE